MPTQDENGQAGIEVTREMIEAGLEALWARRFMDDTDAETVTSIYQDMQATLKLGTNG